MRSYYCILLASFILGCGQSPIPTKTETNNLSEVTRLIEEGLALAGNGADDSAIAKFKKALELDPSNVRAKRRLRDSYSTKNEFTTAEDYAGQLVTQGDSDTESYAILMAKAVRSKNIEQLRKFSAGYLKNGGKERYVKQRFSEYHYAPLMLDELDTEQRANIEREFEKVKSSK